MCELLGDHHDGGKTDLVQLKIETRNSPPARQHPRRVPFAAREDMTRQLKKMQGMSLIQPSKSLYGSQKFFMDYCKLNSVTKPDTHPLPRINVDLLDQLGKSPHTFQCLILPQVFWKIKMHPASQERWPSVNPIK